MDKESMLKVVNSRSFFNKHNGIVVVDIGDDFCIVEGELKNEAMNPWGMAHGGFVYALCDVAAGVFVNQCDKRSVTLSGNMQYLRPSVGKYLRAEAKPIKVGRTVATIQTDVYNDEGVHTASGVFQLFIQREDDAK